ncbi:MAG: thiamine biosynthesis protein ApbE [Alphaproteobacteria bacterium BRH_c36]|nr:MAG: thiamine biosynthesis protein ApbE [Alphaproteobacteria bacterium BRH_c36]
MSRRRFMTITAAACGTAVFGRFATALPLTEWRGTALGASASIRLRHPESSRVVEAVRSEIERLENIFSLYRADSQLSKLNQNRHLDHGAFELLELLGLCGSLNAATGGRFDPSVQPLWMLYAETYSAGSAPTRGQIDETLRCVGWSHVVVDNGAVSFARPGMALTLNGIAQGFIADKIVGLLHAEGLRDVLVETGEFRALGGHPDGGGWPVTLRGSAGNLADRRLQLEDMALATSAVSGTVFDREALVGHILDPVTGQPAPARWSHVSVVAPSAAVADGLSTAMCLMPAEEIEKVVAAFANVRAIYA